MGKVLVEKILRACPVRKVYMLVRPKRGRSMQDRITDMFENFKLFEKMKSMRPDSMSKVVAMSGDITHENLGLSEEDQEILIKECNVIFNVAATINFQEPIKEAVSMNMLGTKRMIAIARKMIQIQAVIHVSTAYANCHLHETYEQLYPAPMDPEQLIKLTEWLELKPKVLESMTPELVHPLPNTYTFTKSVAEHILVNDAGDKVPFSIIRPSIVCGAWREPEPGWVDNLYAFTGLLIGMGKGLLRTLYIKQGIKLDFIPVDVPINLMIVSAYNTATKIYTPGTGENIYCCSTGYQNPLTIEGLNDHLKETVRAIPQEFPYWFPDGSAKTNKTLHTIHMYAINVIPAHIYDFFMKIFKKRPIAVKACNRMVKAIGALEYFMLRDWTFHNENVQGLWKAISPADRQMFHFNVGDMDWGRYLDRYQRGCKKFILKEGTSDEDIERCVTKMNKLWWVNRICQFLMMLAAWALVTSDVSVTCWTAIFNEFLKMISLTPVIEVEESAEDPVLMDVGLNYEL